MALCGQYHISVHQTVASIEERGELRAGEGELGGGAARVA